jgi:hypothetical protein
MGIKYSRLLKIIVSAVIPLIIAGSFIYRNSFLGTVPNAGISLLLAISVLPAIVMVFVVVIHFLPAYLQAKSARLDGRIDFILVGVMLILVLWAAIAATESLLRLFYFGVWGLNIAASSLMSTSSIVLGIMATFVLMALNFHEAKGRRAV